MLYILLTLVVLGGLGYVFRREIKDWINQYVD